MIRFSSNLLPTTPRWIPRVGRFAKESRLLRARDFERVFAARSSASNSCIALYGARNGLGHPRLGITVSRRVGNAVTRNRWKRMLRESFRLSQDKLPALDLVCIARAPSPPPLNELREALTELTALIAKRLKASSSRSEKEKW
jgi:ribonuclease P protein component